MGKVCERTLTHELTRAPIAALPTPCRACIGACSPMTHATAFITHLFIVHSPYRVQAHANVGHFHVARLTIDDVCRSIWYAADWMRAGKIIVHYADWIMAASISWNRLWTARVTLTFAVSKFCVLAAFAYTHTYSLSFPHPHIIGNIVHFFFANSQHCRGIPNIACVSARVCCVVQWI